MGSTAPSRVGKMDPVKRIRRSGHECFEVDWKRCTRVHSICSPSGVKSVRSPNVEYDHSWHGYSSIVAFNTHTICWKKKKARLIMINRAAAGRQRKPSKCVQEPIREANWWIDK